MLTGFLGVSILLKLAGYCGNLETNDKGIKAM
jgi:hypothetical protein